MIQPLLSFTKRKSKHRNFLREHKEQPGHFTELTQIFSKQLKINLLVCKLMKYAPKASHSCNKKSIKTILYYGYNRLTLDNKGCVALVTIPLSYRCLPNDVISDITMATCKVGASI